MTELREDIDTALTKIITKCSTNIHLKPFDEFVKFAQDYYDKPVSTIEELRTKRCNKFKGDLFEIFCLKYLKFVYLPKKYKIFNIWLLKETPTDVLERLNLKRHDMGIDIITQINDSYLAIQCKYRTKPKNKVTYGVTWKELSTFYAIVNRTGPYLNHIVMTNANFVRHVGGKSKKDISICYGSLIKLTCSDMRKMCEMDEGNTLCDKGVDPDEESQNSNIQNIPSIRGIQNIPEIESPKIVIIPKSEIEILREKRLKYFAKLTISN